MKKIKIISKIAEIYHHRHHFWNIPYIMKQEKHIIDSTTHTFFELKNCVTLHIIYIIHCTMKQNLPIESHPFPPFLPDGARVLMLGTFPPKPNRWAMEFFYPNKTNDMAYFLCRPFQVLQRRAALLSLGRNQGIPHGAAYRPL